MSACGRVRATVRAKCQTEAPADYLFSCGVRFVLDITLSVRYHSLMMHESPMTEAQAREIVDRLSGHLKVRTPRLQWVSWSRNGRYSMFYGRIQAGPNCWRGAVAALLHEFAHHLDYVRNGCQVHSDKNGNRWQEYHSRRFIHSLADVVEAHYGDLSHYPWETEYRSIRNFAVSQGIAQTSKKESA